MKFISIKFIFAIGFAAVYSYPDTQKCGIMSDSAYPLFDDSILKYPTSSQFPWLATILTDDKNFDCYGFSGVLVSDRHVLAYARSIAEYKDGEWITFPQENITVYLGTTSKSKYSLDYEILDNFTIAAKVAKITFNPNMEEVDGNVFGSVVLLELEAPVVFNNRIQPICVSSFPSVTKRTFLAGEQRQDITCESYPSEIQMHASLCLIIRIA